MSTRLTRTEDLAKVIDRVVESYDGPMEINNLRSVALPNKRAVCEALRHLRPVLLLGFYSTRDLSPSNLREAIAEHLGPAEEILVEQIKPALAYDVEVGRRPPCPPGFCEDVVLRFFDKLPELRRLVNSDVLAAYHGDPAAKSLEEVVFSYPSVQAMTAYRLAHELWKLGVPMIPRIWTEYAHSETGIDMHPGATIGEAFFVDHGTGVVIGETAHLGAHVKLYQHVTLGALSIPEGEVEKARATKRHPTLEDGVTVYAGATILGGDTVIGAGSVVGANVWLTRSVPPGSKIFGGPKG